MTENPRPEVRILTPDNPTGDPRPQRVLTPEDPHLEYQPQWASWIRQFIAIVLVLGTLLFVAFLGPIAQVLIASLLVSLLMYLPARFLANRTRFSYKVSVALLYVIVILILIAAIINLLPVVSNWVNSGLQQLSGLNTRITTYFKDYKPGDSDITVFGIHLQLDPVIQQAKALFLGGAPSEGAPAAPQVDLGPTLQIATNIVGGMLTGVLSFISTLFLALFLSFLILIELPGYQAGVFRFVPAVYHREIGLLSIKIMNVWRGFLRGQLTLGVIVGVVTWLQLTLMGVQNAVLLSIIVTIIGLIPTIGGFIALVPLALFPLLQGSTVFTQLDNATFALAVVLVNLVISQIIWNVVSPYIMGDALRLPIPIIILGVFFGAAVGGVAGAFLSAPLLGTLRVVLTYIINKIAKQDPYKGETWEAPNLT